jgi:GNAT superfamily N-acetyltransferase
MVRENDIILGGASGKSYWDWLYVKYLWVDTKMRGRGIGSMLMAEIEKVALKRKCIGIHLNTFSFQAHDFYIKNGFRVFGIVDSHPKGHKRYFMSKSLV